MNKLPKSSPKMLAAMGESMESLEKLPLHVDLACLLLAIDGRFEFHRIGRAGLNLFSLLRLLCPL